MILRVKENPNFTINTLSTGTIYVYPEVYDYFTSIISGRPVYKIGGLEWYEQFGSYDEFADYPEGYDTGLLINTNSSN